MRRRTRTHDEGSSTELAITTPLLLLLILLTAQAAIWAHARNVTRAAASAAVETTRLTDGTAGAGRTRADQLLDRLGRGLIQARHVTVTRTATTATVTVTTDVEPVIPGLHPHAAAVVTAPVERFITDARGFMDLNPGPARKRGMEVAGGWV